MSVLSCDKKSCENVMCDRYSTRYGYICNTCFDELVASGTDTDIRNFMGLEPAPVEPLENAYDKFNAEFFFS